MTLLQWIHLLTFLPLAVALLCMIDVSRVLHVSQYPLQAVAYYAVAVGAGACMLWQIPTTLEGAVAMLVSDTGIALLSWIELTRYVQLGRTRPRSKRHRHALHH